MVQTPHAPETRERILEAAVELMNCGKTLSMEAIARAAGVSRQTVYLHFGDKIGLLRELYPFVAQTEGWSPQHIAAILALPAREAFETYFRTWIRTACRAAPHLRTLFATLGQDVEVTQFVSAGDTMLSGFYEEIFAKLEAEGLLRSEWNASEAAQAAWSMTLYMLTVGHMHLIRGWSEDEIEAMQMKILTSAFLNA